MGDADHGHPLFCKLDHHIKYLFDHLRIKGRGGLIKEHNAWAHAEAAGNGNTLLLTARELPRIFVCLLWYVHPLQVAHRRLFGLTLGRFTHPNRCKGAVFEDSEVRKEIKMLKQHPHLPTHIVDIFQVIGQLGTIDDNAPLLMNLQTIDTADQRRFAGSRGAANDDTLSFVNVKIDIL